MKRFLLTASLAAALMMAAASGQAAERLRFDKYYSGPEVEAALQMLADEYDDLAKLEVIGTSEQGRKLYALTIQNPKTGSEYDKPAVYIDGAIHGNEIQATEVCLYIADHLLGNYGGVERITRLVDTRVFYIVPVVNVDNRWRYFSEAGGYGIGRTAIVPYDDDGDGLIDEDGYEDLNGDGHISQMRVRDPFGSYKEHPDDPRILLRVKDGEVGQWSIIGREGIDNDGDGRLNEDTPGYLDMNRNFGFNWQPRYVQSGSGNYPFEAKPTEAVANFIKTKPNISFCYAFHNWGGMFLRGPGNEKDGPYPREDIAVYDYLGEEAERAVPGYRYLVSMDDLYRTWGDFDGFMYGVFGIYGFVGELSMGSDSQYRRDEDEKESDRPDSEEQQRYNDVLAHGEMFLPWSEYDHPEFGSVQLGGWKTLTRRVGEPFTIMDMVHRNAMTVLLTAEHAPEVKLELIDVVDLPGGLKRVRVRASNEKAIPSYSGFAERENIVRPDYLTLEGAEVVSGGVLEDRFLDKVIPVEHHPERIATRIPGFGKREVQWIVRGSGKVKVIYDSMKAANQELELKL